MKVIVSLTSFPDVVENVPVVVRSIMRGSVLPDKIVLYLDTPHFPEGVPAFLNDISDIFEVRFHSRNMRSYKKIVPALADFPDDIIITIDDDVEYGKRLIYSLLRAHKKSPMAIVAHRVRRIELDITGGGGYSTWKLFRRWRYLTRSTKPSFRNLQTGVGGALYPPHSLAAEMMNPDVFMAFAPTVDDIWLWAAAVAAGTKIAPVRWGLWRLKELPKPAELSLRQVNIYSGRDVNAETMRRIMEHYPIIRTRISQEKAPQGTV